MVLIASAGAERPVIPEIRTDPSDAGIMAFRTNEMIVVNDYPSYPSPLQTGIDEETRSLVYLPVRIDQEILGVLSIASKEAEGFKPEITAVLEAYALALGNLLESTRLSERSEVAAEIGRLVSSDLGIDDVYARFAEQARKVVDFDRIAICTLDMDQENFEIAYMLGTDVPRRESGTSLQLTGTFPDDVIKAGRPVVFCAESEPHVIEQSPGLLEFFRSGLKSYIGTPLVANDRVVAVLVVNSVTEHGYTLEDAGQLQVIGDQIAGAIANSVAAKKLQESEARSNALLEDAPQGILVANEDGVITRINKRLESLFGYTREELIGRSIEALIPESIRSDHITHRSGYLQNPVSRAMGEGLRLSGRRKDGSEIPVEIGLSSVDTSDGKLTIAHISDDTLRRESEELQKSIESRLSGDLEAREAELALADQVAEIITSTLDINQVFAKFSEEAKHLVDFDHATIIVIDYESETLIVDRYLRSGPMENEHGVAWELKGSQTEQVMLTGQTMIRDEIARESGFSTDGNLYNAGIRSTILTPLVCNDLVIGSMLLASRKPKAFGPREQVILERLASQIAPAVENARLYEEAVSRTAQLECLVTLAEILGQTIPFEEKVSQVLDQLVQVAQCYSAQFRLPDASGQYLTLAAVAGTPDGPEVARPKRLGEGSLAYQAFQSGLPLVVGDYQNDPNRSPSLEHMGDRSVVFLPISIGGRSAALVTVDSEELGYFTPERVRLLTAIGERLGTLLENSRLSEELRSTTEEMTLVDQVAKIVTSTLDIGQVFTEFADDVSNLVDFDLATVNVIDRDAERFVAGHCLWEGSLEKDYQITWDLKGSLTERVVLTGQTIIEQDLRESPGYSTDGFFAERGLRSTIMTPLAYKDRMIGSMSLASKIPGAFGLREQRILERLANQIAPAVENARLYSESVARAAELEFLLNLAEILGKNISFSEKISEVLDRLVQVADGYSAHFSVPDASGRELVLTNLARVPGEPDYIWPENIGEGSLTFQAFEQRRPLVVDDLQNHPGANPYIAQSEIRSAVYIPVLVGGQAAAVVTVNSRELGHFTPDRLRLLTAIGEGLGSLLENSRLSEELQSTTQEMALIDEVATIITSTLDIEQEYERFALEVKKLVDFDRATLLDVDRSTNSYAIRSTWGMEIPSLQTGTNVPLEGSSLQRTLNSDERILVEDLAPPFKSTAHPSLFEAGLRSHMMVPLIFNDRVTGGITLLSQRQGAFGDREKRIMERLAGQIAPAVENARLFRQAQERTREIERLHESTNRILDSNPSALVVLRGIHREVVIVNSSFRATFRLDQDQIEGQPLSQVLDWVELEECIRESLASPLGEGQKEMIYIGRDGTERWFSISAAPLQLEQDTGYEDEALLVLNDITEQRHQQERFQEQARLASVGQLASGVAHEINNPLAAIHGYSELLQMADLPPQATEDARKIQSATERAAKIVQNLLSFARKSEPEKRYLNVTTVVDQAMALKVRDFELENIRVTTIHSKGIPPTMLDEQQIIQVMLNVLTNAEQAIKAGQGSGEIAIATRMVKGAIRIRVSDDGLGIPSENLHSIFDPFFTTKEVGEGTGLGLSICYGIVRDHGGKMWAESAPGKGAAFYIELLVLPNVEPSEGQSTETDRSMITALRILVVDDEPEVRNILGRVLSADGHEVALASDGQEAWKLIQDARFDRIFLDLRMPGVDGQELYQQIIEYSHDLAKKVVFITGDTARADTERFLESTANSVLGKPFTIEAIRQLL